MYFTMKVCKFFMTFHPGYHLLHKNNWDLTREKKEGEKFVRTWDGSVNNCSSKCSCFTIGFTAKASLLFLLCRRHGEQSIIHAHLERLIAALLARTCLLYNYPSGYNCSNLASAPLCFHESGRASAQKRILDLALSNRAHVRLFA